MNRRRRGGQSRAGILAIAALRKAALSASGGRGTRQRNTNRRAC